jgi:hypothetical protein
MVAVSFIGGGTRRKSPTCRKSLTIFYQLMLCTSPWEGVEPTTSVLIGTDCIGSCKSNYHTIMTTTARCMCDKGKSRLLFVVETRDTFKNEGSDIDYWKAFVGQSTFCFPCERQTDKYVCTCMIYMSKHNIALWYISTYITFPVPSWSWLYDSWIYIYLCNQCPSPLP